MITEKKIPYVECTHIKVDGRYCANKDDNNFCICLNFSDYEKTGKVSCDFYNFKLEVETQEGKHKGKIKRLQECQNQAVSVEFDYRPKKIKVKKFL